MKFNVKRAEKELSVLGIFLFGFENKEYEIEWIYILERGSLKNPHFEVSTVTIIDYLIMDNLGRKVPALSSINESADVIGCF